MAKTIIQANAAPDTATYRLFQVTAPGSLTLKNLTARNGRCIGACPGASQQGGGIYSTGTLKIISSRIAGNRAGDKGGGIMNFTGVLVVSNSTIAGNNATFGAGLYNQGTLTVGRSTFNANIAGWGAGIMHAGGTAVISNSTFGNNMAANMGASLLTETGIITVNNSTFSGNSAAVGAGIANGGLLTLQNTILANSTLGSDCYNYGVIAQNFHNLIETDAPFDKACGTPYLSAAPDLGPLADNGGLTRTFALLPGSPAIDAGDDATCKTFDQRNTARPQGPRCDIGSFELTQQKMHFRSIGAEDGWVLESTETSEIGGTVNSGDTTFHLGDSASDRQLRAILSFNTSTLPDNAVITGAILRIRRQGSVGANPFFTHGTILVDIREGRFSNNAALQAADFHAPASNTAVGFFGNNPTAYWYSSDLEDVAFPYVNLLGRTQFRLRFETGDNDDMSADYMSFYSGDYTSATDERPLLTIYYFTP
jgi:hypothetical protein